jgi:competence protein ComEC
LIEANLKKLGIKRLKYVVATHAHADHIGGLSGVLSQTAVGQVFSPVYTFNTKSFKDFVYQAKLQGINITKPQGETNILLGMSTVSVYAPIKNYKNTNNTSIVVKIIHDEHSFLFTGDIESDAEKDLTESGYSLSATVLKVSHHGSRTSSSNIFLKAVHPEYLIISVGKNNNYGHPHSEILNRLNSVLGKIYRTDISGTITVNSDGKNLFFSTQK